MFTSTGVGASKGKAVAMPLPALRISREPPHRRYEQQSDTLFEFL